MGAVPRLALAAARRRWPSLLFLGFCLAFASASACLALLCLAGNDSGALAMLDRARSPGLYLVCESSLVDPAESGRWWRSRPETAEVAVRPASMDLESSPRRGAVPMASCNFILTEATGGPADLVIAAEGGTAVAAAPGPGEIWITRAVARNYGVKPGESVEVSTGRGPVALTVSAIVIDPVFNGGMINPRRAWVEPGFLARNTALSKLGGYSISVSFKPGIGRAGREAAWAAYSERFGASGLRLTREDIASSYTALAAILGAVMAVLSLIALIGSVALMAASVAQALRADRRLAALYQAIGLSPRQAAMVFALQFLPVIAAFSLLGACLAPAVYPLVSGSALDATGAPSAAVDLRLALGAGILCAVAVSLAAIAVSFRRLGRIRVAEVLREADSDARESGGRRPTRLGDFFPLWATLGFRQARLGLRRSLGSTASVLIAAFTAYACIAAMGAMGEFAARPDFFGFTDSDLTLARSGKRFPIEHADLMARLSGEPSVARVFSYGNESLTFPAAPGRAPQLVYGQAYEGDAAASGYETIRGGNPGSPLEIALAVNTARDYRLVPGDRIRVAWRGAGLDLRVSGIYQSISNMGQGFRLRADCLRLLDPEYAPTVYNVYLSRAGGAPVEAPRAVAARLEADLGEAVDARLTRELMAESTAPILSGMSGAVFGSAALFVLIALASVAAAALADLRSNARSFSLLGLIGMTDRELSGAVAAKAFALALAASCSGCLLGVAAAPGILLCVVGRMGLISLPFFVDLPAAALVALAVTSFSTLAAWLCARRSLRADPRALAME